MDELAQPAAGNTCVQVPWFLQTRPSPDHGGLHHRLLGDARDEHGPHVVRHRDHHLHPDRHTIGGARSNRFVGPGLYRLSQARTLANAVHETQRRRA